ncbi:MAG: dethiobiotin synthase [Thermodesulfobacteriota bacterium]
MKRGFFITGTDTGIGKTFITALIATAMRKEGIDVGVMKPMETGCLEKDGKLIPADATLLKEAVGTEDDIDLINPYRFHLPAAPSIAARAKGEVIERSLIMDPFELLAKRHETLLVEGVGGLMVPINETATVTDLIKWLALPVIIVAGTQLGTINHTLLTVSTARQHGIGIAGIVFNNYSEDEESAVEEIVRFTTLPIIGRIPTWDNKTSMEELIAALDMNLLLRG